MGSDPLYLGLMLRHELERLKHKDVRQRRMAVRRLFEIDDPAALATFIKMLDAHDERGDFLHQDWAHEAVAARALSEFFPSNVVTPVQRHVSAKRLLCSLDGAYYEGLSEASKRSFAVQGGPLSRFEAERLQALEGMQDAMALRRWDDRAKAKGFEVPGLEMYFDLVFVHLL